MTPGNDDHGWVLSRLHAHAAGWLEEREEARLLAHLKACEACRKVAAEDRPLSPEDLAAAQHLPASLIANWESAALEGFERDMAHAHLVRCAECRRDLEALGHAPDVAAAGPAGDGTAGRAAREIARPARRAAAMTEGGRGWIPWAVGGWAVAASLLAVSLALRAPQPEAPATMSPPPIAGPDAGAPEPAARVETFARSSPVVRLTSPERGAESDDVREIALAPGEDALRLVIEPLIDVAPGATLQIRLLAADGAEIAETRVPHREAVHPDRGVVLRVAPRLLESSAPLTVRVSATPAAGTDPETASYRIRFRRDH